MLCAAVSGPSDPVDTICSDLLDGVLSIPQLILVSLQCLLVVCIVPEFGVTGTLLRRAVGPAVFAMGAIARAPYYQHPEYLDVLGIGRLSWWS